MKFAIAAFTLASALLSGSVVDARPLGHTCPPVHHTGTGTVVSPTSTPAAPAGTPSTVATPVPATTISSAAASVSATTSVLATTSVATSTLRTSSAASTPVPTKITTPVTGGSSSKKRGISYNNAADTLPFGDSKVGWAYNWAPSKGSNTLGAGIEYVPMIWGVRSADDIKNWPTNVEKAIAAGTKAILGYNEPDLGAQANISPQDAAKAWIRDMNPYYSRVTLVTPAVTNGGAPMGLAWLDAFIAACNGACKYDAIALHIYDNPDNIKYFQNYVTDAGKKYGKPIWLTEFGLNSATQEQEQTFIQKMVTFLDNEASVARYAYFGIPNGRFVKGGALLPAGETYRNA